MKDILYNRSLKTSAGKGVFKGEEGEHVRCLSVCIPKILMFKGMIQVQHKL